MNNFIFDICTLLYEFESMRAGDMGTVWKISSLWCSKHIDCTLEGIKEGCLGKCCTGKSFWPSRSEDDAICFYLTDTGCSLPYRDKPIVCLMYPLMLNSNNTLILHYRALNGCCKKNYRKGPMIIEAIRKSLVEMFGEADTNYIINSVSCGINPIIEVPEHILISQERERVGRYR
jgi:hypothetical protein